VDLERQAAVVVRSLMRDARISDHITASPQLVATVVLCGLEDPREPMRSLLRTMFEGWILREQLESIDSIDKSPERAMVEACGGDVLRGNLLVLFSHWSNDVVSIAAHYGVGLARKQPDGSLLHEDGTVDTLLKGGELTIINVPAPPSPEHYWHGGQWKAPEQEFDQSQEA
jgi:hypothetical protein